MPLFFMKIRQYMKLLEFAPSECHICLEANVDFFSCFKLAMGSEFAHLAECGSL